MQYYGATVHLKWLKWTLTVHLFSKHNFCISCAMSLFTYLIFTFNLLTEQGIASLFRTNQTVSYTVNPVSALALKRGFMWPLMWPLMCWWIVDFHNFYSNALALVLMITGTPNFAFCHLQQQVFQSVPICNKGLLKDHSVKWMATKCMWEGHCKCLRFSV